MGIVHRWMLGLAAVVLAWGQPAAGQTPATAPPQAASATLEARESALVVRVHTDAPVKDFMLSDPPRFVVDVSGASWATGAPQAPVGGLVRAVRTGQRPQAARLVVEFLEAPRLVEQRKEGTGAHAVHVFELALGSDDPSLAATPKRQTIVIDAGHGGKDPGAIGASGAREKDIVLAAALSLKGELEKRGYEVAMTRGEDRFVPLADRVAFAREKHADLFISLHADAHSDQSAMGASVYTLSEQGGRRAKTLVDANNWQMDFGDVPRAGFVERILLDLAQRETVNRSADFAQALIKELGRTGPLLRRTHRDAGFFVLLAPDVPAVLVELGFLTNPEDERRLASAAERKRAMLSVADAIDIYFERPRAYAEGGYGR